MLRGSVWAGLIIASLLAINLSVCASPVSAAPIDDVIQHVSKLYAQGQIKAALDYLDKQEAKYPKESDLNAFFRFQNKIFEF